MLPTEKERTSQIEECNEELRRRISAERLEHLEETYGNELDILPITTDTNCHESSLEGYAEYLTIDYTGKQKKGATKGQWGTSNDDFQTLLRLKPNSEQDLIGVVKAIGEGRLQPGHGLAALQTDRGIPLTKPSKVNGGLSDTARPRPVCMQQGEVKMAAYLVNKKFRNAVQEVIGLNQLSFKTLGGTEAHAHIHRANPDWPPT